MIGRRVRLDLPELDSPTGRWLYIQTPGRGAGWGWGVEEEGPKEVGLGITKNPPSPKGKTASSERWN